MENGIRAESDPAKLEASQKTDLAAETRNNVHFNAALLFMHSRDYKIADALGRTVPPPVPYYTVDVISRSPIGVYGWLNSDIAKNADKRESRFTPYSQEAAAVLYTDVNADRSGMNVTGKADACKVSFFVSADPYGISCYVENHDDQIDEVLAGLESGGSLEMYLQPGFDHVYYQWTANIYPSGTEIYDWSSPNEHFRSLKGRLTCESAPTPDGFGVYLFIPWDLFYDCLPTEESEWAFGVLPWTRDGGFTWGSGQVHELHKFGRLKFRGLNNILPNIKRMLVLKAWASFQKSLPAIQTFWNDEIRGDPTFAKEALEPYVETLQKEGEKVSAEMTAETAEELFRTMVPEWNEFRYRVDTLRTAFLMRQRFAE